LPPRGASALALSGVDRHAVRCNSRQVWDKTLGHDVKATVGQLLGELASAGIEIPAEKLKLLKKRLKSRVMWSQIRSLLLAGRYNNLGVVPLPSLKTVDGKPVVLFRSGFTPRPGAAGSCFESLVQNGGVRHVANLYAGPMVTDDLEAGERQAITASGGTYFLARDAKAELAEWREDMRAKGDGGEGKRHAMKAVAKIVNEHLLKPGGMAPKGNLHVHCGGGMHRTGMVVGVIDRCLNGTAASMLEADYKRHVGWRSEAHAGGFETANMAFILGFDCSLLAK
jgi:hypothetical protein